jgi:hypothetical protein
MPETNPNSDEQLRTRIIQALTLDERTAALDLRVGVLNEIAHLAGQAPSLNIWNLTERIVLGVQGYAAWSTVSRHPMCRSLHVPFTLIFHRRHIHLNNHLVFRVCTAHKINLF